MKEVLFGRSKDQAESLAVRARRDGYETKIKKTYDGYNVYIEKKRLIQVYPMMGKYYFVIRNEKDYRIIKSSKFYKTRKEARESGKKWMKKYPSG